MLSYRSLSRLAVPCALAALLAVSGCGSEKITGPSFNDPNALEPTAGTWRTWVLANPSAFRPAAPPATDSQEFKTQLAEQVQNAAARTPAITAEIDFWNGGTVRRWDDFHRHLIQSIKPNPPRTSRGLALVSAAMYDAMVAAYDAKYHYLMAHPADFQGGPTVYGAVDHSPSYVSDRVAMSRAACDVLAYLYPDSAGEIAAFFGRAYNAEMFSGNHFRSDVDAGSELGAQVAGAVVNRAQHDNSNAVNNTPPP